MDFINDYTRKKKYLLEKLGFTHRHGLIYYHKFLNRQFDFSTISDEDIITIVFKSGIDVGYKNCQQTIREDLGL
jgi:hypothetical protein